jgi:hypothetical protein
VLCILGSFLFNWHDMRFCVQFVVNSIVVAFNMGDRVLCRHGCFSVSMRKGDNNDNEDKQKSPMKETSHMYMVDNPLWRNWAW